MRKYLIAGLIILLPLALTVMLFVFIVDLFTSPFLNMVIGFLLKYKQTLSLLQNPALVKFIARVLIIVLLLIFIFLLGILARWFFFKALINWTNKILSKIPFVKSIYNSLRDIVGAFVSEEGRKAFEYTTMVEFPSEKSLCIGFKSGEIPKEIKEKSKHNLKPVFLPTAPHPISGYLVLVQEDQIYDIKMSNEDAIKFTVSCGLILPGEKLPDATKK
ncbi:MAG: DUF502 domain-containing protein [Parachlamydiales bacterium]|nr:DUF502 domain-containing protein [Parachlamydiales bacterium]